MLALQPAVKRTYNLSPKPYRVDNKITTWSDAASLSEPHTYDLRADCQSDVV